jgi:hypothetical protein
MKLELTQDQLIILDEALQQLAYYKAAPLIQEINKQILEQENQKKQETK